MRFGFVVNLLNWMSNIKTFEISLYLISTYSIGSCIPPLRVICLVSIIVFEEMVLLINYSNLKQIWACWLGFWIMGANLQELYAIHYKSCDILLFSFMLRLCDRIKHGSKLCQFLKIIFSCDNCHCANNM